MAWTYAQSAAINERNKTLLVSAAAGSGKTATLTERIIRSLTDSESPVDIREMLIVTFTVAAAGELKERINGQLRAALLESPDSELIQGQLANLPLATICTIDSYCTQLVRQNCDRLGVAPNYRIADSAELSLLEYNVWQSLLNQIYRGELEGVTVEEFDALASCLTAARKTDEIYEKCAYVYKKTESTLLGVESLCALARIYEAERDMPPEQSTYGKYIINLTHEIAEGYKAQIERCIRRLSGRQNQAEIKVMGFAEQDIVFLDALIQKKTYVQMREHMRSFGLCSFSGIRVADKTDAIYEYQSLREVYKRSMTSHAQRFFSFDADEWRDFYIKMNESLGTLIKVCRAFDERFYRQKVQRGVFSFSDIERLAHRCLLDGEGELTDVALSERAKYKQIYIDEYQDVNALQDSIFRAISTPTNRFMVGDIKQSIYRFRSAKPEIFARMKKTFPEYDGGCESDEYGIFMSQNFRCDKGVIDFTNAVFDKMFGIMADGIGYVPSDRLEYAKQNPPDAPERTVGVLCVPKGSYSSPDGRIGAVEVEAMFVADRIRSMIEQERKNDGTGWQARDFAILLRSSTNADVFSKALADVGIASSNKDDSSFFLSPEILLMLSLLNAIDNPHKSIYLAGAMLSPIFDFDADELVKIRRTCPEGTLYDSLRRYVDMNPDFSHGAAFLDTLERYRTYAEGARASELVLYLYAECPIVQMAAARGKEDNLMLLLDYARSFERTSYKGLYSFISYINKLIDKNLEIDSAKDSVATDAVTISTIHSSKGLEYPCVFLSECGKPLLNRDIRNTVSYVEDFGIGYDLRDEGGLCLVQSPAGEALKDKMQQLYYEEEMRLIYVAFTRAREALFVTGKESRATHGEYVEYIGRMRETFGVYSARELNTVLDVINATSDAHVCLPFDEVAQRLGIITDADCEDNPFILPEDLDTDTPPCDVEYDEADVERRRALLQSRLGYRYPYLHLCTLPEKISVSALYPTVLDGENEMLSLSIEDAERTVVAPGADAEQRNIEERNIEQKEVTLPSFLTEKRRDDAARRGIATHAFLQFCNLQRLLDTSAADELACLVRLEYLTEEDAALVRLDEIERFRHSELISDMINAARVWRELRFNVLLPAYEFTQDEQRRGALSGEMILVQGVIDCIIEDERGNLRLVDYKTDRLTQRELDDISLAQGRLSASHSRQLSYYSMAIEKMFGRAPMSREVYSLPLGCCVEV